MDAQIQIGEHRLAYRLKKSPRRRTVAIAIHPEQGLIVYSPSRLSGKGLEQMLLLKAGWILAKTQEAEALRARRQAPRWEPGAALPYLGQSYTLRLSQDHDAGVRLSGDALVLGIGPGSSLPTEEEVRRQVVSWYRQQARYVLAGRVQLYQECVGVRPASLRVKDQRRRWGSCSATGALNFNWRLILAPPEIVDYVVVHELCHLRLLNHSPQFWRLVQGVLPDYQERKAWLRGNGALLAL